MSAPSDSRTVARAAGVNLLGMAARASRALVTLFVTRVSGPVVFGLFTLSLAVVDIVSRLALFGMDKSVLKFVPEGSARGDAYRHDVLAASLRTGLTLAVLLSAAVFVAGPWIAARWLHEPGAGTALRIVALSIVPTTLASLMLAGTKALKIMAYDAFVTGMVLPLSLLVLSVPILWASDDLLVLAGAYTASCTGAAAASLVFYRRHFSVSRSLARPTPETLRGLLRFSTPLGLHDTVQFLSIKLEIFVLAVLVSPAELGVYALAAELSVVMRKFRQIFDPILIPVMAEAHGERDQPRVEAHLARVVRWVLVLAVFWFGAVALFPVPLMSLFGEGFAAGALVVGLLCLAQLLNAGTGLLDTAMLVSGRPRINLQNVTLVLVTQTTLNLWLVPRMGITGAGLAALASYGLVSAVRLVQTRWLLGLRPFHRSHLKPLAAGAGAAAVAWLVGSGVMGVPLGPWSADAAGPFPGAWVAVLAVYGVAYAGLLRGMGFEAEDAELVQAVWRRRRRS